MRPRLAAALVILASMAGVTTVVAQTVPVQYGGYDDYSRGDDGRDYGGGEDPFYDRDRYGRDDRYDRYNDGRDRYGDYGRRDRDFGERQRRYIDRDEQRDVVVKRLSKRDKRCLAKHSTYDPESGTYDDGRGGRRRCRG